MKRNRKALLLLLCAILLVVGSVVGSLAYLTDSESAVNTFTVGKVYIDLNETDVDGDDDTKANEYHLLPGHTYVKDPTITVSADSDECYLFVKVVNGITALEDPDSTVAAQMAAKGWKLVNGNIYVYAVDEAEKTAVPGGEEVKVFETFTIDGDVDNDTLAPYEGKNITVTAYAVQKAGFETTAPKDIFAAAFPNG